MSFVVTVLGSSGRFQTLERACASYLVQIEGHNLWLDAGGGSWLNLQRSIDYPDLDGVLLTHGHPDHTIDVLQAYHARQYGQKEPLDRIPLWAPQETIDLLLGFSKGLEEAFDLHAVAGGEHLTLGGARLSLVEMAHPETTLGVRIELGDVVIAFSSDTGAEADFDTLAGGADLFVCEATSQDSDPLWEGHLRASQAGAIAARVGAKKLVLTHLPSGRDLSVSLEEARATAGGVEVVLAEDGSRMELA
jgi:ribonuclease BN (tRNA processing enzyme)